MKILKILIVIMVFSSVNVIFGQDIQTLKNGEAVNWIWGDRVFMIMVPTDEDFLRIRSTGENYYALKAEIKTRKSGVVKVARGNPWRSTEQEILVENPHSKDAIIEGTKLTPWYIFLIDARNVSLKVEYYKGLRDLEITGPWNILGGSAGEFKCIVEYNNGEKKDVTNKAHWDVNNRSGSFYSTVKGFFATSKLSKKKAVDKEVEISATYEQNGFYKTAYKKVKILQKKLSSISIKGPKLLRSKLFPEYKLIAEFTDGSTSDVTDNTEWKVKIADWRDKSQKIMIDSDKKGKLLILDVKKITPIILEAIYKLNGETKIIQRKIDLHPDSSF
ncbi:hypothetical protein KAJ27_13885 [bacterium]|nr:hypothetical protein [bacterium]